MPKAKKIKAMRLGQFYSRPSTNEIVIAVGDFNEATEKMEKEWSITRRRHIDVDPNEWVIELELDLPEGSPYELDQTTGKIRSVSN